MKTMIKKVANKNIKQIPEWVKQHPDCFDSASKQNDKYLKQFQMQCLVQQKKNKKQI